MAAAGSNCHVSPSAARNSGTLPTRTLSSIIRCISKIVVDIASVLITQLTHAGHQWAVRRRLVVVTDVQEPHAPHLPLLLGEGKERGSERARAESDQYFSAFAHSIIRVACIRVA